MAISRLVAGAVDELKPEDVSIIDADTDRSLGSGHDEQGNDEGEEATLDAAPDQHFGAGGRRQMRFAPASMSTTIKAPPRRVRKNTIHR